MSFVSKYSPEGEKYCQNSDCPQRGKSFKESKMYKGGRFIFCSPACKQDFEGRNILNDTDTSSEGETAKSE